MRPTKPVWMYNGLMTREEGFAIARKDCEIPQVLDYFLKITNMSDEEFYRIFDGIRLEKIKDVDLPKIRKDKPNAEVLVPFMQQIIDKHLHRKDPRETE